MRILIPFIFACVGTTFLFSGHGSAKIHNEIVAAYTKTVVASAVETIRAAPRDIPTPTITPTPGGVGTVTPTVTPTPGV